MVDTSRSPLRLALIGMSGVGKTFWTKRLAQVGFMARRISGENGRGTERNGCALLSHTDCRAPPKLRGARTLQRRCRGIARCFIGSVGFSLQSHRPVGTRQVRYSK